MGDSSSYAHNQEETHVILRSIALTRIGIWKRSREIAPGRSWMDIFVKLPDYYSPHSIGNVPKKWINLVLLSQVGLHVTFYFLTTEWDVYGSVWLIPTE